MQKRKYDSVLRCLGLSASAICLCGAFSNAAADDTSIFSQIRHDIAKITPDAKPLAHTDDAPPWRMRVDGVSHKPRTATVSAAATAASSKPAAAPVVTSSSTQSHPLAQNPALSTPLPGNFPVSANLLPDYMKKDNDVPFAVTLPEYAQYSAAVEHHASVLNPPITTAVAPPPKQALHLADATPKVTVPANVAPVLRPPRSHGQHTQYIQISAPSARTAAPVPLVAVSALPPPVAPAPAPAPAPVPVHAAQAPLDAGTDIAMAPDPVDRKKLPYSKVPAPIVATDNAKTGTQPLAINDVHLNRCVILPWLLPQAPERVIVANAGEKAQTIAEKIIMLDQRQNEVLMASGGPAEQTPQPSAPPYTPPAPVLIPPQNPAEIKTNPGLDDQSKKIVDSLPPEKPKKNALSPEPVEMQHLRKNALETGDEVKKHNGVGIEISVRQPKVNVSKLLNDAYEYLISGNQEGAITAYKHVLDAQPANKLALFGLATTYHRAGQLDMARPLYGKLLEIDPYNYEGLNNFLVLLSDENPAQAIVELDKLEKTHPGFSPIPAQLAIIYEKTGDYDRAAEKMNTAINLSPENLKYRYNMAIILDKKGDWADAAVLYQQLLTASERGEKISAKPEEIQQRLTFILSNRPKG